jgi:hypothetical protein
MRLKEKSTKALPSQRPKLEVSNAMDDDERNDSVSLSDESSCSSDGDVEVSAATKEQDETKEIQNLGDFTISLVCYHRPAIFAFGD